MSDCSFIDPLVTPYVDGELPVADREAIAQHLRDCPPCRARVSTEQAVRDLVHARQPALQRDRASDALRAKCAMLGDASGSRGAKGSRGAMGSERTFRTFRTLRTPRTFRTTRTDWRARVAPLALAATLVLVVVGASFYQITARSTPVMAAELAADHVKCFLLQDLIGTRQAAGPVEYALASKFGWSARLPERPDRAALELVGERTCLYGQGRVAHIMYRHEGRPVSLFMLPNNTRKDEVLDTLGHEAAVWSVGGRTFVLIGREPKVDFERMALFVRTGLH
jgi:anti-sigma factor RsiW